MNSVISIETLSDYIGVSLTGNAKAKLVVDSINKWVENYTHRYWGNEEKTITETHDLQNAIYLRVGNIKELTSLTISGETSEVGKYDFNKATGRLILSNGDSPALDNRAGANAVTVTYKVKCDEVPADLILASLELAGTAFKRKDGRNVASEGVGGYSVSYNAQAVDSLGASNPVIQSYTFGSI